MSLRIDPRIFAKYPGLSLTDVTTAAVLVIEALPPVTREELEAALAELQQLTRRFCGEGCRMTALIHMNEGGS